MDKRESKLDRLLHSAAKANDAGMDEMPFGFDIRVLAHWRAEPSRDPAEVWKLVRLIRRIALSAAIAAALASTAAYWQLAQDDDFETASSNAYAIADNAIETGAFP